MKYETKENLPDTLRSVMPEEAQEIYLDAYKKAWDDYEEYEGGEMEREGVAHRKGMHAVGEEYVRDRKAGVWYKKGEKPEELKEDDEDDGFMDDVKDALPGV